MNTLQSYQTTSPYDKTEECARFIIDDISKTFILSNIMEPNQEYTFSFWVRSESDGRLIIRNEAFSTSTEWHTYVITFTTTVKNFNIGFGTVGTYDIYHPQLEIGNKVSDYSPAPEDSDRTIEAVSTAINETVTQQSTAIISTCEELILQAREDYVTATEYDEFTQSVENEFKVMSEGISVNITEITNRVDSVDEEISTRNKYFAVTMDGILLTAGEHSMNIRIDNDIIVFEKDGVQFGWWDGVDFHTGNIVIEVTERAQFGNFAFVPRSDGSLSFLKVGET